MVVNDRGTIRLNRKSKKDGERERERGREELRETQRPTDRKSQRENQRIEKDRKCFGNRYGWGQKQGRLLELLTNIRLSWKILPMTNTPAHNENSYITDIKSFYNWTKMLTECFTRVGSGLTRKY